MKRKTKGNEMPACLKMPIGRSSAMLMLSLRWTACHYCLVQDEETEGEQEIALIADAFSKMVDEKEKQIKENAKALYQDKSNGKEAPSAEDLPEILSTQLDDAVALALEHRMLDACAKLGIPRYILELEMAVIMGELLMTEAHDEDEDEDDWDEDEYDWDANDVDAQQRFEDMINKIVQAVPPSGKAVPFPGKKE